MQDLEDKLTLISYNGKIFGAIMFESHWSHYCVNSP